MPITKAMAIMTEMVGTQLDANCFAALQRSMERLDGAIAA
jgi:HD-GYP domain-containing protein (c-di-GMP phosphodiesterase class II)